MRGPEWSPNNFTSTSLEDQGWEDEAPTSPPGVAPAQASGDQRRPRTSGGRLPRLVVAGLAAQLVGIAAQAVFHLAGTARVPLLTQGRTSLIDHVVSNIGVACLTWQAGRWITTRTAWSTPARRIIIVGTGIQLAGALADAGAHLAGGEQPAAFAAIGAGYLLVVTGALLNRRGNPSAAARLAGRTRRS